MSGNATNQELRTISHKLSSNDTVFTLSNPRDFRAAIVAGMIVVDSPGSDDKGLLGNQVRGVERLDARRLHFPFFLVPGSRFDSALILGTAPKRRNRAIRFCCTLLREVWCLSRLGSW
jgi:hypothetical protein